MTRVKDCACCQMSGTPSVAVMPYTVAQGTRAVPKPDLLNWYCNLCARHIASLGVALTEQSR